MPVCLTHLARCPGWLLTRSLHTLRCFARLPCPTRLRCCPVTCTLLQLVTHAPSFTRVPLPCSVPPSYGLPSSLPQLVLPVHPFHVLQFVTYLTLQLVKFRLRSQLPPRWLVTRCSTVTLPLHAFVVGYARSTPVRPLYPVHLPYLFRTLPSGSATQFTLLTQFCRRYRVGRAAAARARRLRAARSFSCPGRTFCLCLTPCVRCLAPVARLPRLPDPQLLCLRTPVAAVRRFPFTFAQLPRGYLYPSYPHVPVSVTPVLVTHSSRLQFPGSSCAHVAVLRTFVAPFGRAARARLRTFGCCRIYGFGYVRFGWFTFTLRLRLVTVDVRFTRSVWLRWLRLRWLRCCLRSVVTRARTVDFTHVALQFGCVTFVWFVDLAPVVAVQFTVSCPVVVVGSQVTPLPQFTPVHPLPSQFPSYAFPHVAVRCPSCALLPPRSPDCCPPAFPVPGPGRYSYPTFTHV